MATISTLAVNLIIRTAVFERGIKRSRKQTKAFKDSLKRLDRAIIRTNALLKSGIMAGIRGITSTFRTMIRWGKRVAVTLIAIGVASVKVASDVRETENLFNISMGSMAKSANRWAREYSKSLGLFTNDTKKALGTFQLMLTSMGLTENQAFKMSKQLTTLANDIASFRNQDPASIFLKLQAGITGESEPLKRLGILVNESIIKNLALTDAMVQARVESERSAKSNIKLEKSVSLLGGAYKNVQTNGFVKQIKNTDNAIRKQGLVLTDVEKVLLRYKAIVNATTKDQGDMKRTLDDTANVFRVIWAQVKVTANTIGTALLPVVTKVAIVFRDWLTNNQALFRKWAKFAATSIQAVIDKLQFYFTLAKAGNFEAIFKDIGKIFGGVSDGLIQVFEKVRPFAVDVGGAMAEGFIDVIEGTKLGKFLAPFGEIPSNVKSPFTILDTDARRRGLASRETRSLEGRIGSLVDRATGRVVVENRSDAAIITELKAIRLATEENNKRF